MPCICDRLQLEQTCELVVLFHAFQTCVQAHRREPTWLVVAFAKQLEESLSKQPSTLDLKQCVLLVVMVYPAECEDDSLDMQTEDQGAPL